jgi:hypothetical protein
MAWNGGKDDIADRVRRGSKDLLLLLAVGLIRGCRPSSACESAAAAAVVGSALP